MLGVVEHVESFTPGWEEVSWQFSVYRTRFVDTPERRADKTRYEKERRRRNGAVSWEQHIARLEAKRTSAPRNPPKMTRAEFIASVKKHMTPEDRRRARAESMRRTRAKRKAQSS
mgnify:FL=1